MHAHTIPTDAQISLIGFEESLATTRFIIALRDLLFEISGDAQANTSKSLSGPVFSFPGYSTLSRF